MATDVNFESHYEDGTVIADRTIPEGVNALDYSDILKFSECSNATVSNCNIEGGKEDAIVKFAELIAAAERKDCADIAEYWRCNGMPRTTLADQIRARGKND